MSDVIENFREVIRKNFKPLAGLSVSDIENDVHSVIDGICKDYNLNVSILSVALTRFPGFPTKEDAVLTVIVEYDADIREDALFNILCEKEIRIADTVVDINPIRKCETGTLEEYLQVQEKYLKTRQLNIF